ncbi:MAG: T9SS type A sorting domain-containing protein [Bacteroidales bacterium]|jgi:hypothetical protein|nr:T9SS type A sorting domain-containing protein [Bacteroidales bacterium]
MNRFHFKVAGYERGNRDAYGHVADDLRAANTDGMHEHLSINGVMDNLTKERSWRKPISKASKVILTMGLLLLFLVSFKFSAQGQQTYTHEFDSLFANVNLSGVATGILYDRVVPFAGLKYFTRQNCDTSSYWHFVQAYSELQRASLTTNPYLPLTVDSLKNLSSLSVVPIGILNFDFDYIDTNAYNTGRLYLGNDSLWYENLSIGTTPFVTGQTIVMAPLRENLQGSSFTFTLNATTFFTNRPAEFTNIAIDFDNGLGFQNINLLNDSISVTYASSGEKKMCMRIVFSNGDTLYTYARIKVISAEQAQNGGIATVPPATNNIEYQHVTADIPYLGFAGQADIKYYYSGGNLYKPILIVDGFDPQDKRNFDALWDRLNYVSGGVESNVGNDLLALGYDLVFVNFPYYNGIDGGADFIERNAFTVIKVINEINSRLQASGSEHEIVVVGPSMGGQITRYALAYMEQNPSTYTNQGKHNCRLWISFDSPHCGANIAFATQALLHFVGRVHQQETAKDNYDKILSSPAAKQMLIDYIGDPSHSIRNSYVNTLNNIGYPNSLRKIAVANGSITGTKTGDDWNEVFNLKAAGGGLFNLMGRMCKSEESSGLHTVFYGYCIIDLNGDYKINSSQGYYEFKRGHGCGIDASSGGTYRSFETAYTQIYNYAKERYNAVWDCPTCEATLSYPGHCFIPTASALGYQHGTDYPCENLNVNLVDQGKTPFASYWAPTNENMEHITINASMRNYLINEIETYITGDREIEMCNTKTYTLHLPNNVPANTSITWTCSNSLRIVAGQGTNTVIVQGAGIDPNAWICAEPANLTYNRTLAKFYINVIMYSGPAYQPAPNIQLIHEVWTGDYILGSTLTIPAGYTLELQGRIYSTPTGKIIVEKGGKLIVDGGMLTNECNDDLWEGIEVRGTGNIANTSSFCILTITDQNNNNQGVVELRNDAIIQNAKCGIYVGNSSNLREGGGIVKADNAHFINNKTSIEFRPFENYKVSIYTAANNVSYFTRCTFTTDMATYVDMSEIEPMVKLYGVRNVKFAGCDFLCQVPFLSDLSDIEDSTRLLLHPTIGIYCNNAGVLLAGAGMNIICCPGISEKQNTFSGFSSAIHVINSGTRASSISQSQFFGNKIAVSGEYADRIAIGVCHFNLTTVYPEPIGVQLSFSHGYVIDNNSFINDANNGIGVHINNSGTGNNVIENNTFTKLLNATISTGTNAEESTKPESCTGLQYRCNTFNNNCKDILVEDLATVTPIPVSSSIPLNIRHAQGLPNRPARNLFHPVQSATNIYENTSNTLLYFWGGYPTYFEPLHVWEYVYKSQTSISGSCYDIHWNRLGRIGEMIDMADVTILLDAIESEVVPALSTLDQVYNEVNALLNDKILEYKDLYLNASVAPIDWAVVGENWVVMQDEPQIVAFFEIVKLKEDIALLCRYAFDVILNPYAETFDREQYNIWSQREETLHASYATIESALEIGQFQTMDNILNNIMTQFPDYEANEYDKYRQCLLIEQSLFCGQILNESNSHWHTLEDIAFHAEFGLAAIKAKSILERFGYPISTLYYTDFLADCLVTDNLFLAPPESINPQGAQQGDKNRQQEPDLQIYPNPTDNILHIIATDATDVNIVQVQIFDIIGKALIDRNLSATKADIDLSVLAPGMYFVRTIFSNGRTINKHIVKQ